MSDKTAASPGPAPIAKPPKRRRWLRQVLLGIVILACGVVIGGGLTIKRGARRIVRRLSYH